MLSSAGVESRSGRSRVTAPWRSTGRAGRHSSAVWTLSGLQCGRGCSGMQTEGRLRARLAVRCFVPRGARRAIESFVRAKMVVAADFSTNVTGEKRRMAVLSLRWYQNAGAGEPGSKRTEESAGGESPGLDDLARFGRRSSREGADGETAQSERDGRRNERGAKVESGIRSGEEFRWVFGLGSERG